MSRESISIVEGGHKFQDGSILNSSTRTIIVELQKTFIGVLLEVEKSGSQLCQRQMLQSFP